MTWYLVKHRENVTLPFMSHAFKVKIGHSNFINAKLRYTTMLRCSCYLFISNILPINCNPSQ
jgi:hypothetical protein